MCDYCEANRQTGSKYCVDCGTEVNTDNKTPLGCFKCLGNILTRAIVMNKEVYCPSCGGKIQEIFDPSFKFPFP